MKLFVTGTDTEIGKTYVSRLLLQKLNAQKLQTIGLKPVASGCEWIEGRYINRDAYILQQTASIALSYVQVNPFCFSSWVSPHIAAQRTGITLTIEKVCAHLKKVSRIPHDIMIIEGVGGLMVPFNDKESQLDLVKALGCPVLFVVGLKLGCLNHTLLSINMLKTHLIPIEGWVVNHIDPAAEAVIEMVHTLKVLLKGIPYRGYIPFGPDPSAEIWR